MKQHTLQCSILALVRGGAANSGMDFTFTLGYAYNFSDSKNTKTDPSESGNGQGAEQTLRFRHQGVVYSGTQEEVHQQLTHLLQATFTNNTNNESYSGLLATLETIKSEQNLEAYKIQAITFLDSLTAYVESQKN